MAPQQQIPIAASVLGTIGTVLWCIQLVPQIYRNHRTKSTAGLPGLMLFLWAIAAVPFGVYAIVQNFTIPIQVQPQIFCALCLCCWAQTLHYGSGYRAVHAAAIAAGTGAAFAGAEAGAILALKPAYARGTEWPVTLVGIVATVLLVVGLLPPYGELYRRGGRVVGISFAFLTIDFSGATFSLLALVAQHSFDVLGGTQYCVCLALELGIFASQAIWLLRTRRVRAEAKRCGLSYDEFVARGLGGTKEKKGGAGLGSETSSPACSREDVGIVDARLPTENPEGDAEKGFATPSPPPPAATAAAPAAPGSESGIASTDGCAAGAAAESRG